MPPWERRSGAESPLAACWLPCRWRWPSLCWLLPGLLVRTLNNLKSLDPGFNTHSLLLFGVDPRLAGYKGPQVDNLYRELATKILSPSGSHICHLLLEASAERRSEHDQLSPAGNSHWKQRTTLTPTCLPLGRTSLPHCTYLSIRTRFHPCRLCRGCANLRISPEQRQHR